MDEDFDLDQILTEEINLDGLKDKDEPFPTGDGSCDVCGAPTFRPPGKTKSGQKHRVPKYCDLHSPNSTIGIKGPESKRLAGISLDLADNVKLVGVMVGPVLPVTGYIIIEESDEWSRALVKLASKNPRILKAVTKASQTGSAIQVGKTLIKVGIAMNVDTGRIAPDSGLSAFMGIYDVWKEVHPEQAQQKAQAEYQPPPRYSFVEAE